MSRATLEDVREYIEALASEGGEYYLVCARYGDRPVPSTGLRFESRATARAAARATARYRQHLRQYDDDLPYYDIIVCQEQGRSDRDHRCTEQSGWTATEPVVTGAASGTDQRLIEFCHRIAGAVFEALSKSGYRELEGAVMDCYFELAESVSDPDDLCLCLLESTAEELAQHLSPTKQAAILARAASELDTQAVADQPVAAACADLRTCGLVEDVSRSPWAVSAENRTRRIVVELSGYALSPRGERLPVLPVIVDCFGRGLDRAPTETQVEPTDDGWEVTFVFGEDGITDGLASAPIQP
ncbi:hypothetical protein GRX03_09700 [Halovenus sp. WSH3]|uniref:Uncharacterized protein n=1 Tax=Halovenus carboxidivorans TaxID=2692199 RepID=A0A6B0T4D6_9EURY|nr:hypothetical protein [Halovenus carboxidivorans]MXR51877.1 hypothetical protein [Halovenus carboxidivorans]